MCEIKKMKVDNSKVSIQLKIKKILQVGSVTCT